MIRLSSRLRPVEVVEGPGSGRSRWAGSGRSRWSRWSRGPALRPVERAGLRWLPGAAIEPPERAGRGSWWPWPAGADSLPGGSGYRCRPYIGAFQRGYRGYHPPDQRKQGLPAGATYGLPGATSGATGGLPARSDRGRALRAGRVRTVSNDRAGAGAGQLRPVEVVEGPALRPAPIPSRDGIRP